jgi:putative transposase
VIRFIAEHKDHQEPGPDGADGLTWGVEPLCAVLSEHGVKISPSTYYKWVDKAPTKRQLADAELVEVIRAQREDKKTGRFVQTLGARGRDSLIWPHCDGLKWPHRSAPVLPL